MRRPTSLLVTFFLFAWIAEVPTLPAQVRVVAEEPGEGREPFLPELSLSKATEYLDSQSRAHEGNCCACHGSFAYLTARPALSLATPRHHEVRLALEAFSEKLAVAEPHPERAPPLHVSESVMMAAVLAQHDAATAKKLHPLTRKALDRIWDLQREDGGWSWFINGKPPSDMGDAPVLSHTTLPGERLGQFASLFHQEHLVQVGAVRRTSPAVPSRQTPSAGEPVGGGQDSGARSDNQRTSRGVPADRIAASLLTAQALPNDRPGSP